MTNHGPDPAQAVNVSDAVPAGIPAANVTWTGPNGTGTGAINENFATLNVGQTLTYSVVVSVPSNFDQQTNLVNTVAVTSTTPDPNPVCLGCTDTDTPLASANLVVSKSDSRATYLNNTSLTYSITIANLGPSDAVNVQVNDPLPPQITSMTWEGSNGSSGTGALQDIIASLAVGQVVTYQVTIFVPQNYDLTHTNLTNTVSVSSDTTDPQPTCPACPDVDTASPNWVTIDTSTYTLQELVEDVLIHSECANVSNFTSQGYVSNTSPSNNTSCVGYFHHNNSDFPIKDGVIIGTAQVAGFQGQYTSGNNLAGSGAGDAQLLQVSNANGGTSSINDAAFVQFDFTPLTDSFSFEFLFASEEYGPFQCTFGDVFAFLLTDLSAPIVPGVNPINVAVIPGVTPPTAVSVLTVRDQAYNGGCPSSHPEWYDIHNADFPALSAINIRGQLLPMVASATVIPNHNYRIKLAIGDYQDNIVNSAVFLEAGSFNVGQTDLYDSTSTQYDENHPDLVGPYAGCPGESFTIQAGSSAIVGASYQWFLNDLPLPGETNYQLTLNQPGVYSVIVSIGGGCQQTDSITVEYLPDMPLGSPTELLFCEGQTVNLTDINSQILNGLDANDYEIHYHSSQQDALYVNNLLDPETTYPGTNGEVIYASIQDLVGSGCIGVRSFTLTSYPCGNPVTPPDMYVCDTSANGIGSEPFDISGIPAVALGANTTADYTLTVHLTQADADNDTGAINTSVPFVGTEGQQLFIRMETVTDPSVYETTFFTLHLYANPDATLAASATSVCTGAAQPVITFMGTGGTAPYTFTYTINGGTPQPLTSATGSSTATITIPTSAAGTFVVDLINIADVNCNTNQTDSVTVVVNPGPEAVFQAPVTTACVGAASPQLTMVGSNGTAPYTFTYTINGSAPATAVSDAAGQYVLNIPTATAGTVVVNLIDVSDAQCTSSQDDTVTFNITTLPEATISSTGTVVCQNGTSPTITFTGSGGVAPYLFDYTINGAPSQITSTGDTATITVPTTAAGPQVVVITNIASGACSQAQNDTVTITVGALPTATVSASVASACVNGTQPQVTFTGSGGTAPYTFAYTLNGSANTALSDATGIAVVSVPMTAGSYDYTLTSVSDAACSGPATASATVVILPTPEATVAVSAANACVGSASPVLTFTGSGGTQPYTFHYTINGTPYTAVSAAGSDTATATINTAAAGVQTIVITDVADANCTNPQNDSVAVTILTLPTATITSDVSAVCQNGSAPVVTFTGSGGTAPYTFTYTVDGATQTATTTAGSGSTTVAVPTGAVGIFTYELVSVSDASCSQGQTGTVTITVNPLPTAQIAVDVTSVCEGGTQPIITFTGNDAIAPYTFNYTLNGSANNITTTAGNTVTLPVPTNVPGTYTYVLTSVSESGATTCSQAQSGTVVVVVNPLPQATVSVNANAVCLDSAPAPVVTFSGSNGTGPYTFTYTINSGAAQTATGNPATITIPTNLATAYTVELVSVSDSAAPSCSQAVTGQSQTVSVIAPPVPAAPSDIRLCDDNNDGYQCFDLTAAAAQATGGSASLSAAFYLTATDAQVGGTLTDIDNVTSYCTIYPGHQTLYVRVWDIAAPACAAVTQLELYVDPSPVANGPIADFAKCDADAVPGTEAFTLSDHIPAIAASAAGVSFTFYHTQAGAASADAADQITDVPYVSAGETVWVRLETAAGCTDVASFELVVWPLPAVATPLAPRTECVGADGMADFGLDSYSLSISQGIGGVSVSYYASQADAEVPQFPLPSPYHTASTTVWVRLDNEHCFTVAPLGLVGQAGPAVSVPQPIAVCDDNNDCFATFDLTQAEQGIWGSPVPAGVSFAYYLTQTDAEQLATQNQIGSPAAYANIQPCDQTVWVAVTAPGGSCPSVVPLAIHVAPRPEANESLDPLEVCDGDGDGLAWFEIGDPALAASILDGMSPASGYQIQFFASQADIPASPIPPGTQFYQSASATLWVVVTDIATGCTDTVELSLVVLAQPAVADIPPYRLCDDDFDQHASFDLAGYVGALLPAGLQASFYHTQAEAEAGSGGEISSPHVNDGPTQAAEFIWVRIENAQGCYAVKGMDIVVDPKPVPFLPAADNALLFSCDDNNDGHAAFDLSAILAYMQQGVPAGQMALTVHPTQTSAEQGTEAIAASAAYVNVEAGVETLWVAASNPSTPGQCRSVWPIVLTVEPAAVADPLPTIEACADGQDGFAVFDLTQNEQQVLDAQTGSSTYTITYYTSLAAAQAGSPQIGPVTAFQNTVAYSQQIWYRVDQPGDCDDVDSFMLQVNSPLALPASLGLFTQCADPALGQFVPWDLAQIAIPGLTADYQVHYYPSLAQAQSGQDEILAPQSSAYVNASVAQTIGIAVTHGTTGCTSYTIATLQVLPLPHPRPWQAGQNGLEACEQGSSGTASFDLTQFEAYLANGDANMHFSYFATAAEAEAGTSPIGGDLTQYASAGGTVYVRVEEQPGQDSSGQYCHVVLEIVLTVDPQPALVAGQSLLGCEYPSGAGQYVFDLNDIVPAILAAGQDPSGFSFSFADASGPIAPAGAAAYTNQSSPQAISVTATDLATGCQSTASFDLVVKPGAAAAPYVFAPACDTYGDITDGIASFDLTQADATVLAGQPAGQFAVSYYASLAEAQAGTPAISPATAYETGSATLYAVVYNYGTGATPDPQPCHSDPVAVTVSVEAAVAASISGDATICVDWATLVPAPAVLTASPSGAGYSYQWSVDGVPDPALSGGTVSVTVPGDYTVVVTSAAGCASAPSPAHAVAESSVPSNVSYTVSGAFQDHQSIQVHVEGVSPEGYEYSLDGGPWVANGGLFENVGPGEHAVGIRSPCGSAGPIAVLLINYPHFFTPDGDGIHDLWNTVGLQNDGRTKIYIFDRYGKLIKQIAPDPQPNPATGWDGTLNGHQLPSTDYWFLVEYPDPNTGAMKEFRSHFSLKR